MELLKNPKVSFCNKNIFKTNKCECILVIYSRPAYMADLFFTWSMTKCFLFFWIKRNDIALCRINVLIRFIVELILMKNGWVEEIILVFDLIKGKQQQWVSN